MTYTFVDVSGFAGGFSCGATLAGFKLVGKREEPANFGTPLLEANRAFLGNDWEAQAAEPADWEPVSSDLQVSTPPCSAFSSMTAGSSKHGMDSEINNCMRHVMMFAAKNKPQIVIMESVGQAFTKGLPLMRELGRYLNDETGLKYSVTHVMQNNWSTGGCTKRKRYFLVLSQVPFGVERFDMKRLPTVGDAFADLADLDLTWEPQAYRSQATWWSDHLRNPEGTVDGHWSPVNIHTKRLDDVVNADNGVEWKVGESDLDALRRYYETHGDLPDSWKYKTIGRDMTRAEYLISVDFKIGGFSKPRRWPWDQPGRVINGAGPFQVWHPNGRFITHRETARLLGFPDSWKVGDAKDARGLHSFWGKGTSVHPAQWIAEWAKASLDGNPGSYVGEELDAGDRFIDVSTDWKALADLSHVEVLAA